MENIAYIGSWKHFVFVFVCVWVSSSLYLYFCKSSFRPMSSPDDKLSENIWFVWSRTSYGGDKWRCHAWSRTDTHVNIVLEFCEVWTEFAISCTPSTKMLNLKGRQSWWFIQKSECLPQDCLSVGKSEEGNQYLRWWLGWTWTAWTWWQWLWRYGNWIC